MILGTRRTLITGGLLAGEAEAPVELSSPWERRFEVDVVALSTTTGFFAVETLFVSLIEREPAVCVLQYTYCFLDDCAAALVSHARGAISGLTGKEPAGDSYDSLFCGSVPAVTCAVSGCPFLLTNA